MTLWLALACFGLLWLALACFGLLWLAVKLGALLHIPAGGKTMAILCLGKVEGFYPKPMLEMEGWAERQDLAGLVFENGWEG